MPEHANPSAREALFSDEPLPARLAACDHYAGNPKFLDKALLLQSTSAFRFDITADLEDGAGHASRPDAVALASDFAARLQAASGQPHFSAGARIHPTADPRSQAELQALLIGAGAVLSYIMLPKARHLQDVQHAAHSLRALALSLGLPRAPALHVLIETHGALADVHAIAALGEVQSLSFGLMDFVSAHHGAIGPDAMQSPGQFEHPLVRRAKLEISAAAHAHGKTPSHNVCVNVRDPAQAGRDAARARAEFGYTRMWSIHPDQIEPICRAFANSDALLLRAQALIARAQAANWAPIEFEGELHDRASYRYFQSVLDSQPRITP